MIELKPCPFCGSTDIDIFFCEEACCGAKARSVDCECGCTIWVDCIEKDAIEKWNQRSS